MTNINTAMGLAFIQAQQRANQQEKSMETEAVQEPTDKSMAHRVFDYLTDEGVPLDVHSIAKALGVDNQKVSTALFQLKKVGYVMPRHNPGAYMTYEVVPGRKYGDAKTGPARGARKPQVSQVVTPKPEPRMIAMPAPAGLMITVRTSTSAHAFDPKEAREVYKQLSALFGAVEVSYDD